MAGSTPSNTTSRGKRSKDPRDTPAMRQYRRFKEAHPDCVLFFRMGDFYEMFDEDAQTVHTAIGLTLTQRSTGIPMAGVPYHAAEGYIHKMISQGFRVAVCDQIQDPTEAKGIVDRAVTRVLTPGTLVDESLLDAGCANSTALVLLDVDRGEAIVASAELSTGRFEVLRTHLGGLVDEVARLSPSELLVSETDAEHACIDRAVTAGDCARTIRPPWTIDPSEGRRLLQSHWGVATLEGWGIGNDEPVIAAAGGLLRFLLDTMPGEDRPLSHMQPPVLRDISEVMQIDAATLRHLEIERTTRTGSTDGSLLDSLRCCVTPMGRRLLREWLCWPLTDRRGIESRHDVVAALLADGDALADLVETVGRIQDVARIAGRAATGRITPRDLVALGRSVQQLPALRERLELIPAAKPLCCAVADLADTLVPLGQTIYRSCVDDPPAHLRDGGLFRTGIDTELDASRSLQNDGSAWLASYQAELSKSTGIPSLKVGFNKVFGYYIEVTHAHTASVPPDFVRKQTLKNAERYITDRLKTYEEEALGAQANAIAREQSLFVDLVTQVDALSGPLRELATTVATIDVLCGFATLATQQSLVRPVLTDGLDLDIRDGRHPVLDARLGSDFVPNDCLTVGEDGTRSSLLLITGPNMAGKSTYIRQVALTCLMAQAGCFVPASAATLGIVDRLFARIGAADELHAGMSTFMVEMTETANILHNATERSLVVLDEIGRGTSTLDGLSLAWAITEALARNGCRTLFATHYHEITELGDRIDGVGNRHVAVQEWDDRIVFLHRIKPGATNRSYGVHVGRLAGLPPAVITRAKEVLDSLAVHHATDDVPPLSPASSEQLNLFTQYVEHPAMGRLRELNLDRMSPMDAFDALRELYDSLEDT
ncbi:MAG: DNA mismatch repair protein MutS [Planctomycetes bacterium]|nr:DNA mismatch repair protein MutS [Planctomycetota bacterium]MCP4837782.1 DNA mismatch repair protein MutS [Planctomycetota bacterium]